jgi:DNA-binding MarR family transcriptional regulator
MFMVNGFAVDGDAGLVQMLEMAQREVARSFAEVEEPPMPLRGSQFRVLAMVPRGGGRRLTELAVIAGMTKQAMGEFVADLAEAGLVTLSPDPADRRAKLVSLTSTGREAADAARDILARVQQHWADRLGATETETLVRLLRTVAGVS